VQDFIGRNPAFEETALASLKDPVDPAFVREFQESTLARPPPLICFDELGYWDCIALRFSSIGAFAIGS
jgi:hypothetical protein